MGCDPPAYKRKAIWAVTENNMTRFLRKKTMQLVEMKGMSFGSQVHIQFIGEPATICGEEIDRHFSIVPFTTQLCFKCGIECVAGKEW